MIKARFYISILLIVSLFTNCAQTDNSSSESSANKVDNYTKLTNNLKMATGSVRFDTLLTTLSTHRLDSGANRVFVYERTGVTMIDANDWEAKYTETLIFQIDSLIDKFEYCDSNLKQIDCKYYWICLAKEIKKEVVDIEKGCIKMDFSNDSILIDININSGFEFGDLLDNDKERVIKYKTF